MTAPREVRCQHVVDGLDAFGTWTMHWPSYRGMELHERYVLCAMCCGFALHSFTSHFHEREGVLSLDTDRQRREDEQLEDKMRAWMRERDKSSDDY